jgi:porphobilinogen synthase
MTFPFTRMRRLRRNETFRRMVRETRVSVDDLIMPLFVREGVGVKNPIGSMPGQFQWSVDTLAEECQDIEQLGIPAVILFGIPDHKDAEGSEAHAPEGVVCRAIEAIKEACTSLVVITDVCLCATACPMLTTTPRSTCSSRRPWPTSAQAPTWSRPRT